MILINDNKKELLSLKFIRNLLNLSIYDFASYCRVDSSLISKMESGKIKYLFKYKEVLLSLAGVDTTIDNKEILYDDVNDALTALLYKNNIILSKMVQSIDFNSVICSKYFLDYFLISKITSMGVFSHSISEKFNTDKLDSILLKIKDSPRDTEMLISIYFIYKELQSGKSSLLENIANNYNKVDKYSHFVLYLQFLDSIGNMRLSLQGVSPMQLAFYYKNITPNLRARQIISVTRALKWLLNPTSNNFSKLIASQNLYTNMCDQNQNRNNRYTIIGYQFIQGHYTKIISYMKDNSNIFNGHCENISAPLYFMCCIASLKIGDTNQYKNYLNILKNRCSKDDVKYLVEIAIKYPTGKSIKRPMERQINKIFSNRKPINILILLLEYYKIYDISEFESVKNFLAEHPDFKLF